MSTLTLTETTGTLSSTYQIVNGSTYAIIYSTDTQDPSRTQSTISAGRPTYLPVVKESTVSQVSDSNLFTLPPSAVVSSTSTQTTSTLVPLATTSTITDTGPTTATPSSPTASSSTASSSKVSSIEGGSSPNSAGGSVSASNGVSTGAAAGIGIGCAVVGALIAALFWLIMSRRQKKQRSTGYGSAYKTSHRHTPNPSNEKALPSAPFLAPTGAWEKHLDQPESDNTITRSVKGLFDHIEVHVENFYRDASVPITPSLQDALLAVRGSRDLPDDVAGLLPLTDRPTLLIKHCIAHAIVEHIDFESGVTDSFLPPDFVALPMALGRRGAVGKPAFPQAYSRWRVLSSYLRPKPAEDPTYTHARDMHIGVLAEKLCRTFDPWALSRDNFASRRGNLVEIMKAGAETGMLLFSQPGTFRWRWGSGRAGAGEDRKGGRLSVVVLPGVEKVRDEEARELREGLLVVRGVEGVLAG